MVVETARTEELEESEIFHILGNDRRRAIVDLLGDRRERIEVSEVASTIAASEADTDEVPNNVYKSVYVSLQQTHLPQLEEDGVISYNPDEKTIRPGPHFDDVLGYLDSPISSERLVLQVSLGVSVLSLVLILSSGLGMMGLSTINPLLWGVLGLLVVAICSVYCLYA